MLKQNELIEPWISDLGNGMYKNPVLFADYSDPDIVRIGKDFFMIASSFNCIPGLPVLHSNDLVNWKIVNHITSSIPLKRYDKPCHGGGIWAPTLTYNDGKLYIYVCTPDEGLFMSCTTDPFGEWPRLTHVKAVTGWIDPVAFWDDNGQAYLLHGFAGTRVGFNSVLHLVGMSTDGTKILDTGRFVIDGNERHYWLEGPRMFKRNGYYYISAPAGTIEHGYHVTFRSKNIHGPYEEHVSIHEGTSKINGPRQGGFVTLENNDMWFMHFQDKLAYGRVVNLEPVTWKDDWMIIGVDENGDGIGEPVDTYKKPDVGYEYPIQVPQTTDEFESENIGLQWQWHSNIEKNWYKTLASESILRLYAAEIESGIIYDAGHLLLQKFPAPVFAVETKMAFKPVNENDIAGLIVSGLSYRYLCLGKNKIMLVEGTRADVRLDAERLEHIVDMHVGINMNDSIYLCAKIQECENAGASYAEVSFSYSCDGENYTSIGDVFCAEKGHWIGSKIGIFCATKRQISAGYSDFDYFRVTKI